MRPPAFDPPYLVLLYGQQHIGIGSMIKIIPQWMVMDGDRLYRSDDVKASTAAAICIFSPPLVELTLDLP